MDPTKLLEFLHDHLAAFIVACVLVGGVAWSAAKLYVRLYERRLREENDRLKNQCASLEKALATDRETARTASSTPPSIVAAAARDLGKPYALESVTAIVRLGDWPARKNARHAEVEVHIVYSLVALRHVTSFDEEYSSNARGVVHRLSDFGLASEVTEDDQREKAWNAFVEVAEGQRKTVVTGARYSYELPFPESRDEDPVTGLKPNEYAWSYPSTDFIGELTILIESALPIEAPAYGDAKLTTRAQPRGEDLSTPQLHVPGRIDVLHTMLARWENVRPDQIATVRVRRRIA